MGERVCWEVVGILSFLRNIFRPALFEREEAFYDNQSAIYSVALSVVGCLAVGRWGCVICALSVYMSVCGGA